MPDLFAQLQLLATKEANLVSTLVQSLYASEGMRARHLAKVAVRFRASLVDLSLPPPGKPVPVEDKEVLRLISEHPALHDAARAGVFFDLAAKPADAAQARQLDALRRDAVEVITRGMLVAAALPVPERHVAAVVAIALGADLASYVVREALLGRLPDKPIDPSRFETPKVPLIDQATLNKIVLAGTLRDAAGSFQAWGRAVGSYAEWATGVRVHANGITAIKPRSACAGDVITLVGSGFSQLDWKYTEVLVPNGKGGCLSAKLEGTPGDGAVAVRLPKGVGIGCVGFRVLPGPPPSDPVEAALQARQAAGMLQSVLGDRFGIFGVALGQVIVNAASHASLPALPCPACLPNGENRFNGGPPVIRSFTVNGGAAVIVHPDDRITLAWQVENAKSLDIVVTPAGAPLPAVGTVVAQGTRTITLAWDGVDDWDATYELRAANRCGTDTQHVRVGMREQPAMFGLADTHVHLSAHLAFGGFGVFGRPYDDTAALTDENRMARALDGCARLSDHGPGGLLRSLEVFHDNSGYPQFQGWPRHTTLAHQQCYVDWLRRAYDGGLRLAVNLAVNNEFLGQRMTELFGKRLPYTDQWAIDQQLEDMSRLVAFVDGQSGGEGLGWIKIVRTPGEARQAVQAGKLALVPGVEVDSPGGWHTEAELEAAAQAAGKTPETLITEMVDDLYRKGVRHMFPLHATNNPFGGAALFIRNYDATNVVLTGASFEAAAANPALGIAYRLDEDEFTGGPVAELLGYYGINELNRVTNGAVGRLLNAVPAAIAATLAAAPALATTAVASVPALIGLAIGLGPALAPALLAAATGVIAAAAPVIGPEVGNLLNLTKLPRPPRPTNWATAAGGHVNRRTLTHYGAVLLEELMKRGMVIDVDHMGHHTLEATLEICERNRYPVVAGHTGFRALKHGYSYSMQFDGLAGQYPQYGTTDASGKTNKAEFGTYLARALSGEVDKSEDQLRRIRQLGGLVSIFLYQRDINACQCSVQPVANDAAGTSKSFAQALLYVNEKMNRRRVAIGSDINGAGMLPGPRFGTEGAPESAADYYRPATPIRDKLARKSQVLAQRWGTRYATPLVDYRGHHRFPTYGTDAYHHVFDREQRDFWEAIAIWRSGTVPDQAEQPSPLVRPIGTQLFIVNLAKGLAAGKRDELRPGPIGADEQLAACLLRSGSTPLNTDPPRVHALVTKFRPVWQHWQSMEEGRPLAPVVPYAQIASLYSAQGALTRCRGGQRDWDINLDGMAHYGLLPDFLQDVRNVGMPESEMASLYRSAEDYIRVWELCERRKLS